MEGKGTADEEGRTNLFTLAADPWMSHYRLPLQRERFRPGLLRVEVNARGLVHAMDLVLSFADGIPLQRFRLTHVADGEDSRCFRGVLWLTRLPTEAFLELRPSPGTAEHTNPTVRIDALPILERLRMALGRLRDYWRRPGALIAVLRQILSRRADLSFRLHEARAFSDADGARWLRFCEDDRELARVHEELRRRTPAGRPWKVLVVGGGGRERATSSSLATCVSMEMPRGMTEWTLRDVLKREGEEGVDFLLLVAADTELQPSAPEQFALALALSEKHVAAVSDVLVESGAADRTFGRRRILFTPAWSPTFNLESGVWGGAVAVRPEALRALVRDVSDAAPVNIVELLDMLGRRFGKEAIFRVPRPLIVRRRETDEAAPRIARSSRRLQFQYRPGTEPSVSVLIPSKDHPEMLSVAVESVLSTPWRRLEVVIIDNGSRGAAQRALLKRLAEDERVKVLHAPGPFNFAALNNQARQAASGEVLVLLNDDTRILSPDWLSELAGLALTPDVGCVGPLLLYPDGRVQHAGVVVGLGGPAEHAFRFANPERCDDLLLRTRREVSAVTGACLAVSAALFDELGGLDERFAVTLNDVDFCLRALAAGRRNIYTPHVRIEHRESVSRGLDRTPRQLARLADEVRLFTRRWGDLSWRDPFYHPALY